MNSEDNVFCVFIVFEQITDAQLASIFPIKIHPQKGAETMMSTTDFHSLKSRAVFQVQGEHVSRSDLRHSIRDGSHDDVSA